MKPTARILESTLLAESDHWQLLLAPQDPYPGQAMAWAKRDVSRFDALTNEENEDLKHLAGSWFDGLRSWLNDAWQPIPERYGLSITSTPQLHARLIPQHAEPISMHGFSYPAPRSSDPHARLLLSDATFERYRSELADHIATYAEARLVR